MYNKNAVATLTYSLLLLSRSSFLLIELNHILGTIEESNEGYDLLEHKYGGETIEEEFPANAECSTDDSLIDTDSE